MQARRKPPRQRWIIRHRGLLISVGLVILVLVVARLALPVVIKRTANARLSELPAHRAHIEEVGLSLFRGAYQFEGVTIAPRGTDTAEPLLSIRRIDFSLAWRELIKGLFVADIVVEEPVLTLRPGMLKTEEGWGTDPGEIVPLEITRLEIRRGIIRYLDLERTPPIDLALHNISATIDGLAFGEAAGSQHPPAQAEVHALAPGDGQLRIVASGDPTAQPPQFEIAAELSESDLTAYSDLVRSNLGVDVSAGTLHVSFEAIAEDGRYEGYVKPLIKGAEFEEPDEGPLKSLWTAIVNTVADALKNDETRKMGTKVPFSGNFDETDVEAWPSFLTLLRNGFGRALREGVDGDPAEAEP